jgi:hypothetical protein
MVMTMLACHMTAAFLISAVCAQPSPPGDLDLETTLMVTHLIIGLFCSVTRCDTLSRARHLTQCQTASYCYVHGHSCHALMLCWETRDNTHT